MDLSLSVINKERKAEKENPSTRIKKKKKLLAND